MRTTTTNFRTGDVEIEACWGETSPENCNTTPGQNIYGNNGGGSGGDGGNNGGSGGGGGDDSSDGPDASYSPGPPGSPSGSGSSAASQRSAADDENDDSSSDGGDSSEEATGAGVSLFGIVSSLLSTVTLTAVTKFDWPLNDPQAALQQFYRDATIQFSQFLFGGTPNFETEQMENLGSGGFIGGAADNVFNTPGRICNTIIHGTNCISGTNEQYEPFPEFDILEPSTGPSDSVGRAAGIVWSEVLAVFSGGAFARNAKGVSVIGPRATYRQYAKNNGAHFLDVSDEAWSWAKNQRFLDDVIARGDDVEFAGTFNPANLDPNSVLAREINYLIDAGYRWLDDYSGLVKP